MSDYIQETNIPPEIDPESGSLEQVVKLAKSIYKKLYELEERVRKMETFFGNEGSGL